jgi:hypothetical protein
MADGKFWPSGCNKSELKLVKRQQEAADTTPRDRGTPRPH